MNERLLQYIWQFQYFNHSELQTTNANAIQVIFPGKYNTNQGPDFLEGRIRIDDTLLVGHIELHINASDWDKHQHQQDINYRNVILHVVWHDDLQQQSPEIPLLVLEDRIANSLLYQYKEWMGQKTFVPCSHSINTVIDAIWVAWKERLLTERLQRKTGLVLQLFEANNGHWEETFWQLLAKNFGMKINGAAFESIAKSLPLSLLAKHKNQLTTLEALFLGQAGLLEKDFSEEYPKLLRREFLFHQHKYQLRKIDQSIHFLRMRPATFPTIRLAQLAMLIHQSDHLFSQMKQIQLVKKVKELLDITANDYWHTHYMFEEVSPYKIKHLGDDMVNNIIVNTIVPVLFAYGHYHKEQLMKDNVLKWMQEMPAEKNTITRGWQSLGIVNQHLYDSQSVIELKTQYCDAKKCLDCAIGNALLKTTIK